MRKTAPDPLKFLQDFYVVVIDLQHKLFSFGVWGGRGNVDFHGDGSIYLVEPAVVVTSSNDNRIGGGIFDVNQVCQRCVVVFEYCAAGSGWFKGG